MSNVASEGLSNYPNEWLGWRGYTDPVVGAVATIFAPMRLATTGLAAASSTVAGIIIQAGTGVPTVAGNVGDLWWRTNGGVGSTLYRCTTAGAAGVAVWTAIL